MIFYRIIIVLGLVVAGLNVHMSSVQPRHILFPGSIDLNGPDPLALPQIAIYAAFLAISLAGLIKPGKLGLTGMCMAIGLTLIPDLGEVGTSLAAGLISVSLVVSAFLKLDEARRAVPAILVGAAAGSGFWPLLLLFPAILISLAILAIRWSNEAYRRDLREIDLEYSDLDELPPYVIPLR